jgi:hypothetical protein
MAEQVVERVVALARAFSNLVASAMRKKDKKMTEMVGKSCINVIGAFRALIEAMLPRRGWDPEQILEFGEPVNEVVKAMKALPAAKATKATKATKAARSHAKKVVEELHAEVAKWNMTILSAVRPADARPAVSEVKRATRGRPRKG